MKKLVWGKNIKKIKIEGRTETEFLPILNKGMQILC